MLLHLPSSNSVLRSVIICLFVPGSLLQKPDNPIQYNSLCSVRKFLICCFVNASLCERHYVQKYTCEIQLGGFFNVFKIHCIGKETNHHGARGIKSQIPGWAKCFH